MKQGIGRLAPHRVASWVSCALATGFACAALIACGGDVEPTADSDESDLSRSATTQTPPSSADKEAAPPAPAAPARAPATREESSSTPSQNLGNQGIGEANHDGKSEQQIKRPPE